MQRLFSQLLRRVLLLAIIGSVLSSCTSDILLFIFRAEIVEQFGITETQEPLLDDFIGACEPLISGTLAQVTKNRRNWQKMLESKRDLQASELLPFVDSYVELYTEHERALSEKFTALYNALSNEQREKVFVFLYKEQSYRERFDMEERAYLERKDIPILMERIKNIFITEVKIRPNTPQMNNVSYFMNEVEKVTIPAYDMNQQQRTGLRNAFRKGEDLNDDFLITIMQPYLKYYARYKQKMATDFVQLYNSLDKKQRQNFADNAEKMEDLREKAIQTIATQ